jgi:hypothetical protein
VVGGGRRGLLGTTGDGHEKESGEEGRQESHIRKFEIRRGI